MPVLKFDLKSRVGEGLDDFAVKHNTFVFHYKWQLPQ